MSFWKKTDVKLFLVLIPVFKLINFFITFSEVVYNATLVLAFSIDIMQGYICWLVLRYIILRMEKKQIGFQFSTIHFVKQVLFTSIVGFIVVIIVPDGSWMITGKRYAASDGGFFIHDLVIFLIWILMSNFIYVLLRYYEIWKKSEAKLESERTLKTEGITVKIGDKNIKVPIKEVLGFFVEDGYTYMVNSDFKTFVVDSSLDNVEQHLPTRFFFRVNRKFILHRNAITSFKRIEDNKLLIITMAEKPLPAELPMSRLKAPAFKKWFEQDIANI